MSTKNQQTTRVINSIISPWNGINRKENWITEIQMQLIHYVKIGEIHTTLRTKGSRIGSSKCPSDCNFITSRTTLHVIHYNQSQMPKQKNQIHNIHAPNNTILSSYSHTMTQHQFRLETLNFDGNEKLQI